MTAESAYLPGDVETRMGIEPISELLAQRDKLVRAVALLRARHGPGGVYGDQRKVLVSTIAMRLRAEAFANGTKVTESYLDDAAHSDDAYARFIADATSEKAAWAVQENAIEAITEQINRGQAIARFLAAEVSLAR